MFPEEKARAMFSCRTFGPKSIIALIGSSILWPIIIRQLDAFLGCMERTQVVIACVVIVVVWASFVGYVSWSMLAWILNVASFRETLQNGGFRIIHATSKFIPSFFWLPPRTVFGCQNQTQFIQVAHSLNMAGQLLGENNIYELDIFHFYAVTSDTTVAYEYTPPYPSSLDPLIGELLAYLPSFS